MADWITHLMIADRLLARFPSLDARGFCVGSIAPDCNVENADWTGYEPPKRVTHWMASDEKQPGDARRFLEGCLLPRRERIASREELGFLLGYYAHLAADARYGPMLRSPSRIAAAWARALAQPDLAPLARELPPCWESIKALLPKPTRRAELARIGAEYLRAHPDSGYLRYILPLRSFPDYLDYLPPGAIARKIGVMGGLPEANADVRLISITLEETDDYVDAVVRALIPEIAGSLALDYPALTDGGNPEGGE